MQSLQADLNSWILTLTKGKNNTEMEAKQDKLLKLALSMMDKLIKDEFNRNGMNYLSSLLVDRHFLNSVCGLALDIEGYIRDDEEISFEKILSVCELKAFDFWRVLISFAKLSTKMPYLLMRRLLFLEMHCFLELFWIEKTPIIDLIRSQAASSLEEKGDSAKKKAFPNTLERIDKTATEETEKEAGIFKEKEDFFSPVTVSQQVAYLQIVFLQETSQSDWREN